MGFTTKQVAKFAHVGTAAVFMRLKKHPELYPKQTHANTLVWSGDEVQRFLDSYQVQRNGRKAA